jgi:heme-degrading monooxygenase HmoA
MKKLCLVALLLSAACQEDDAASKDPTVSGQPLRCAHDVLEADLESSPWMGPAADPESNELMLTDGASYIVSSTYGVPHRPDPSGPPPPKYLEMFGAIEAQLQSQPGLLALRLSSSNDCGSGRTLAVWRSEDEMYAFVTSPAHFEAMKAAGELLQPGYAVTHWEASSRAEMTHEEAVRQLHRAGAH